MNSANTTTLRHYALVFGLALGLTLLVGVGLAGWMGHGPGILLTLTQAGLAGCL